MRKTFLTNTIFALLMANAAIAVDSAGVKDALKPYVDRLEIPGYVKAYGDRPRESLVKRAFARFGGARSAFPQISVL